VTWAVRGEGVAFELPRLLGCESERFELVVNFRVREDDRGGCSDADAWKGLGAQPTAPSMIPAVVAMRMINFTQAPPLLPD
jgi:hypothetical protein